MQSHTSQVPLQMVSSDRLRITSLSKNEQVIKQVSDQVLNKHQTSAKHLPYINNTNNVNVVNEQIQKNKVDLNFELDFVIPSVSSLEQSRDDGTKKKLRKKKGTDIPPEQETVLEFFKENNSPIVEAEKFFNHFQSNGWLVGGKSKMKDWKAAARNWLLNANKFQPKANTPQANHLHTLNHKNYDEPL